MAEALSVDGTSPCKTSPIDDSLSKQPTADGDNAKINNLGVAPSKVERNFNIWSLLFMSFCTGLLGKPFHQH